jgi:plastocyanin
MSLIKSNFMKNKARLLAAFVILSLAAVGGCSKNDYSTSPAPQTGTPGGGNSGGGTNTSQVVMKSMAFSPANITVAAGTTVTWTNEDPYQHTVTSGTPGAPDGKFDSGLIGQNATFSYKFDTKGTFNYYCRPHQQVMKGTVTVQ